MDYYELEKKIVKLYSKLLSITKVAYRLDLDSTVISFFLKNAGVKITRTKNFNRKKELPIEEIKRLYLEVNMSPLEIAVMYDVSSTTIYTRLKENGVKTKCRPTVLVGMNKELLTQLYVEEKKTAKEIGKMFNTSGSAITYYLHKYEIPIDYKRKGRKK